MTQILFVCTANRYRSVIAEACFKHELLKRNQESEWSAHSAGTWTTDGLPPMSEAIQKSGQIGLDIRGHRSKVITEEMLQRADLVLVMEGGQKEALRVEFPTCREKILLLSEVAKGVAYDIPDPVTNPSDLDVVSKICDLIQQGFDKICAWARR